MCRARKATAEEAEEIIALMGNEVSEYYTPPIREPDPLIVLKDYDHRVMPYAMDSQGTLRPMVPGTQFTSSISGGMLATHPRNRSLHFLCLNCGKEVYDGGLGKCANCVCGAVQQRKDDDTISYAEAPNPREFSALFKMCNNRLPPNIALTELRSITLGVFTESLSASFRADGEVDYGRVLGQSVIPYFSTAERCIGLNDYIETPSCSFKVLGCQSNFGVVGKNTQIIVSQSLSCSPLDRIHILPMQPHTLADEFVRNGLLPYLRSGPVHLHSGQLIVVRQIVCVVVAATPDDGLVTSATQVFTQGEPLASLAELHMTASIESIPPILRSLPRIQMIWALLHLFIVPHYRGRMRTALTGYRMLLEGVVFKINRCWPQFGVVTEYTRITCEIVISNTQVIRMVDPNTGQIVQMLIMPGSAPEPRGLAPDVLAALPERQLETVPSSEDNKKCMVCLDDYEVGATVKTLPCFHLFHKHCIDEWLTRNTSCPVCKTECDQL
mmetsp:Transcript_14186/g.26692  ORF Transcript_14186/g.26692 Transcript_14186/m.26692 type:complete len:497 (-) Transcript_14186:1633-3123(-)